MRSFLCMQQWNGISCWRSPPRRRRWLLPYNSIYGCLSQYCRHGHTIVHSVLRDSGRVLFSLSLSHWPLSFNILHISITWYLLLALSGRGSFVSALSRHPTTVWTEFRPTRYSSLGGHPQRPRRLFGLPLKVKSRFHSACSNADADSNRLDDLRRFSRQTKLSFWSRWRFGCVQFVEVLCVGLKKKKKKELLQPDAPTDEQVVFWNVAGEVNFKQNSK